MASSEMLTLISIYVGSASHSPYVTLDAIIRASMPSALEFRIEATWFEGSVEMVARSVTLFSMLSFLVLISSRTDSVKAVTWTCGERETILMFMDLIAFIVHARGGIKNNFPTIPRTVL